VRSEGGLRERTVGTLIVGGVLGLVLSFVVITFFPISLVLTTRAACPKGTVKGIVVSVGTGTGRKRGTHRDLYCLDAEGSGAKVEGLAPELMLATGSIGSALLVVFVVGPMRVLDVLPDPKTKERRRRRKRDDDEA